MKKTRAELNSYYSDFYELEKLNTQLLKGLFLKYLSEEDWIEFLMRMDLTYELPENIQSAFLF